MLLISLLKPSFISNVPLPFLWPDHPLSSSPYILDLAGMQQCLTHWLNSISSVHCGISLAPQHPSFSMPPTATGSAPLYCTLGTRSCVPACQNFLLLWNFINSVKSPLSGQGNRSTLLSWHKASKKVKTVFVSTSLHNVFLCILPTLIGIKLKTQV